MPVFILNLGLRSLVPSGLGDDLTLQQERLETVEPKPGPLYVFHGGGEIELGPWG